MNTRHVLPICALFALMPIPASAQDSLIDVADSGDTAWILASAAIVTMMALPGIALFYAGQVRTQNMVSIVLQCAAVAASVSLAWIVAGYTLAFGDGTSEWIGNGSAWMLVTLGNVREGTEVPESAFVLLQMAFAASAAILMTGAWAERARFGWVIAFCTLWSLIVYAPVAHWIWGNGWLAAGVGALDWSGGIVVHTTAGVSALVAAIMMGRRKPYPRRDLAPYAPIFTVGGAGMLWAGLLAIAGGTALAANDDASAAIIASQIAAASGALIRLLMQRLGGEKPTGTVFALGALSGLATAAPAAGYISPGAGIIFGTTGAIVCHFAARFVRERLNVDDCLSVFATHGVGGMLGSVLLGVFLSDRLGGVGYDHGMNMVAQTVSQIIAVGIVAVWSVIATVIIALMASVVFPMRVSENSERDGLDISWHGQPAPDRD